MHLLKYQLCQLHFQEKHGYQLSLLCTCTEAVISVFSAGGTMNRSKQMLGKQMLGSMPMQSRKLKGIIVLLHSKSI